MDYNFDEVIQRRGTGCVKWDESGEGVIPLWVADMDFAVAPAVQEAVRRRAQHPVFGYTYVQDDYYDAVIGWFQRRHQWQIEREWVLYTTGVVPAMSVAVKALTMPGERVLILSPDYNCFFSSIKNNGCEVAESILQLGGSTKEHFEVDWADFEQQCSDEKTTVFLLCNPHNPTGRVWTRTELQHMADICRRHQVTIVSDEIHCELTMPGQTFVPMGTVEPDAIILNSPSKSFNIAGLQMANIICRNAAVRRRLDRAININEVCDVNPFGPVAVMAAYNEGGEWIDALNRYLWDNYCALRNFARQHLPQWRVMPLEGTYLVWVDVTGCTDSVAAYCEEIKEKARVWLNPGTMYGRKSGEGYLRINIACPRSLLMEALTRIKDIIV
jgi:cystathionine beta-lyase